MRKRINISVRWLPAIAVGSLFVQAVFAQGAPFNSTVPSQIMEQFRNQRTLWTTNVWVYANTLFGILAVIEFAWSAAVSEADCAAAAAQADCDVASHFILAFRISHPGFRIVPASV